MRIRALWASVLFGLLACSSNQPPVARVASQLTFAATPLVTMANVSLIAAGGGFTMAGYEGGTVRWGRVSLDGVLSLETAFPLAQPVLGPFFAVAQKAAPADQLITLVVVPSATVSGGYDLQAIVQGAGAAAPASPVVLASLQAGTDPSKIRVAAGGAKSGATGFVAWGVQNQNQPVQYLVLGADATVATRGTAFDRWAATGMAWDCLAPTNGTTGLGFSIVGPDLSSPGLGFTAWTTAELDESGAMSPGELSYSFQADIADCNILGSPAANGGYDIAFSDSSGIGGAFYYPPPPGVPDGTVMPYPILLSANSFGDLLNVPTVAWAAPAGNDMMIGLARRSAPYAVRFTYQAVPHGSALVLPSANGNTGPVAAWVGPDFVYVTYSDQVVGPSGGVTVARYFVKIEAAAQL